MARQGPEGLSQNDVDAEGKTTTIIPDEHDAPLVIKLFELYATGNYCTRSSGWS